MSPRAAAGGRWADTTEPAATTRKAAPSSLAGRRATRRVTLDLYAEQSEALAELARSAGVPQASLLRALVDLAANDQALARKAARTAQHLTAARWSTP